jgi:hypothetical protein
MMAARVQALIGVAGETITYKRVTHGAHSTATLQSAPSVQSYTIKAGVRQYRAREIAGLVQQGDREVRIAAADLSFTPTALAKTSFTLVGNELDLVWEISA